MLWLYVVTIVTYLHGTSTWPPGHNTPQPISTALRVAPDYLIIISCVGCDSIPSIALFCPLVPIIQLVNFNKFGVLPICPFYLYIWMHITFHFHNTCIKYIIFFAKFPKIFSHFEKSQWILLKFYNQAVSKLE